MGVCTHGHLKGISAYTKLINKIENVLDDHGYKSLDEIRGLTIKRIEQRAEQGKTAVIEPIVPDVDHEKCILCGKCEEVCVYDAIVIEGRVEISPDTCTGCGLCREACIVDPKAIEVSSLYKDTGHGDGDMAILNGDAGPSAG